MPTTTFRRSRSAGNGRLFGLSRRSAAWTGAGAVGYNRGLHHERGNGALARFIDREVASRGFRAEIEIDVRLLLCSNHALRS